MENDSADLLSRRVTDLSEELDSLRSTLHRVLIVLLIGTAGIGAFVFQNYRTLRRETEYEINLVGRLQDEDRQMAMAVTKFKDFAVHSPDYAATLKKYGLKPEAAPASAPVVAPAKK